MIANNTIIFTTLFFLSAFALSTFFLLKKYPAHRGLRFFKIFFYLFLLGIILTSLRNKIPDFFSLQLALSILALGLMFLYVGLKDILGLDSKWYHRYFIPVAILFCGIFLFTYIYYDLHMRIIIFSLYISIYALSTAWIFYQARLVQYRYLNFIASFLYVVIGFVFLLRAFNATNVNSTIGDISSTVFIVNAPYVLLCMLCSMLIVMSNVYLRKKD